MSVITSPARFPLRPEHPTIFLAGSIENGQAEDWQAKFIANVEKDLETAVELRIATADEVKVLFLNPRRANWDPELSIELLEEQITWELDAIDTAHAVFMYLQPGTMSPISLLELGLLAHQKKLVVCCPDEFWRSTNVNVTCRRYKVPVRHSFADAQLEVMMLARQRFKEAHA